MYCRNCGKELPAQTKFCMYCGADQNGQGGGSKPKMDSFRLWTIIAVASAVVAVLLLIVVLAGGGEKKEGSPAMQSSGSSSVQKNAEKKPAVQPTAAPTTLPPETEPPTPENGWYDLDGETFYNKNGVPVTGLQEIGGKIYYFNNYGAMQKNTTVSINSNKVKLGYNGVATEVCYASINGSWSDKKFSFGNNGKASIRNLDDVTNCTSCEVYIQAEGKSGAKVNGTWKIHLKINGKWKQVDSVTFKQPSGTFQLTFDSPVSFDAITAYPTVKGNASYSVYFTVQNAWCNLS